MPPILRRSAIAILAGLPPALGALLQTVTQLATERGWRVAIVGGSVRDLVLGVPLERDLDIVVEGDAPALAEALAGAYGGRVTASHAAFGTATVLLPASNGTDVRTIDLAGARTETYAHPAALPTVAPSTLEADLARRDFTVNAMAVEMGDGGQGRRGGHGGAAVRDLYGGMGDLEGGVLRVLHGRSFEDDPTRVLRGLRLAARLGLRFEPETRALLDAALAEGGLERTTPDRMRNELCLVLEEPQPEAVLRLSDELSITPHVFPSLRFTSALSERMERARAIAPHLPPGVTLVDLALGLLTYDLASAERDALVARYRLPSDAARLLREVAAIHKLRTDLANPALPNSQLDRLLQPFGFAALTVVCLAEPASIADAITHYLNDLRPILPLLNGRDLLALGISAGPRVGALLADLRAALLDGIVHTREEGIEWIRRSEGRRQRAEGSG